MDIIYHHQNPIINQEATIHIPQKSHPTDIIILQKSHPMDIIPQKKPSHGYHTTKKPSHEYHTTPFKSYGHHPQTSTKKPSHGYHTSPPKSYYKPPPVYKPSGHLSKTSTKKPSHGYHSSPLQSHITYFDHFRSKAEETEMETPCSDEASWCQDRPNWYCNEACVLKDGLTPCKEVCKRTCNLCNN